MTEIVTNPTKLDDLTVKKLEEGAAMDCSVAEMCTLANITRQTYYNWVKSFPDMAERLDSMRQNPFLKARKTIVNSLDDPEMAFKYMERKRKHEFSGRTELTGANGADLTVKTINLIVPKEINGTDAGDKPKTDTTAIPSVAEAPRQGN